MTLFEMASERERGWRGKELRVREAQDIFVGWRVLEHHMILNAPPKLP